MQDPETIPFSHTLQARGPSMEIGIHHRILAALTEVDCEQFFPDGLNFEGVSADLRVTNQDELTEVHWEALLEEYQPTVIVTGWSTPRICESVFQSSRFCVEYICHLGGSVRSIVPLELIEKGVLVSNWGNLVAASVAEHALLLVLACARNLCAWKPVIEMPPEVQFKRLSILRTCTLKRKRVAIHGFGSVAKEVIRLLQPFGVHIRAYSDAISPEEIKDFGVDAPANLQELAMGSDVFIECEALTEKTRGTVTRELLSSMQKDAIFVNVGRGALVDENALTNLVQEGRLRVATDVVTQEPVSSESPLWNEPDILISPHIAGPTLDLYEHCGQFALDNIRRFLKNEPVVAQVDRSIYLRST